MKFIIYNPETNLFKFFVLSLIIELKKMMIFDEIIHINKHIFEIINNENDIILIIMNHYYIYDYKEIENSIKNISKNFKYKILYISEPINCIFEKNIYNDIIYKIKPYCVWTYTINNYNKIKYPIKMYKVFPCYNEILNITNIEKIINKNINNIIFIGNINEIRKEVTNIFGDELINYNDKWELEEWKEILNKNLFYLNIHRRKDCKSLEIFRINPILCNGGFIISERVNEKEEELYKDYNIIFVERNKLYEVYNNCKRNIDYEIIYEKSKKYREDMLHYNFDLNEFIKFHLSIKKII
jgi:hypothetical protein